MKNYLLLKLTEEAGEVVVAAIKHRLHRTTGTKHRLEKEVGDLLAVVELMFRDKDISAVSTRRWQEARRQREVSRMEKL